MIRLKDSLIFKAEQFHSVWFSGITIRCDIVRLSSLLSFTVFLRCIATFVGSEFNLSNLLAQFSHFVTCAPQKSSFSFLLTYCKCFGASMKMIVFLLFQTWSIAYVMLIKMYSIGFVLNRLIHFVLNSVRAIASCWDTILHPFLPPENSRCAVDTPVLFRMW